MYTVADLLTRAADSVEAEATVEDGLARWLAGDGHDLPVLQGGRVVGLLGARELLLRRERPGARLVRDLMRTEPRTIGLHTPLRKAAELLVGDTLSCLPVLDPDGSLQGALTGADLARFALAVITDFDKAADGLRADARGAARAIEEVPGDAAH